MRKCEYCNKEFKKPSVLRDHINTHTKNRVYKCTECEASYYFKKHLNAHAKKHGPPAYECCGYKFYLKDKYDRHKKVCSRTFECVCGKIYFKEKCYEKHLEMHIMEVEKSLIGIFKKNIPHEKNKKESFKESSGKIMISTLDRKYPADYEVVVVNGAKYIKCSKCCKYLRSKNIFRVHYKVQHLLAKDYKCKCGKEYKYKKNLMEHLKSCINS